jgi:hypothetical protein
MESQDKDYLPTTQEPTANPPKNKKKITLSLVGTFILLIVVIIAINQTGYFGKNLTRIEPSPTLIPTPIISVGDNVLGDNVG